MYNSIHSPSYSERFGSPFIRTGPDKGADFTNNSDLLQVLNLLKFSSGSTKEMTSLIYLTVIDLI